MWLICKQKACSKTPKLSLRPIILSKMQFSRLFELLNRLERRSRRHWLFDNLTNLSWKLLQRPRLKIRMPSEWTSRPRNRQVQTKRLLNLEAWPTNQLSSTLKSEIKVKLSRKKSSKRLTVLTRAKTIHLFRMRRKLKAQKSTKKWIKTSLAPAHL